MRNSPAPLGDGPGRIGIGHCRLKGETVEKEKRRPTPMRIDNRRDLLLATFGFCQRPKVNSETTFGQQTAGLLRRLTRFVVKVAPPIGREGPIRAFRLSIPLRVANSGTPTQGRILGARRGRALAKQAAVQRLSPEDHHTPFFPKRFGSDLLSEFDEGSHWAKGLWVAALLIGILDALRWHSGAGFAYDSQPAWQSAHAILHGGASWARFVYLPGCLLFAFPLALLPFKVTEALVYAVQILGLVYAFWAMTRVIKLPLGSVRVAWAALLFVLCGQLGIAAHYENFSILLLPLAAAFFLSIDSDRPMAAAVILGISLTVKPLLAPLLLPLLLARRWRETAVAVLIPVVLSGLTLLIVVGDSADPSKFWHEVTGTFSADTGKPWNISLTAMAGYLHAPSAVGIVAAVIVLAASLIASWRIWANPRGDAGEQAVWLTAPLFVIVILCSSFSWGYYCLLLVPLGFVSLRQDRVADWAVRLGVFLALAPPLLVYSLPGYPDRYYQQATDHIFGLGILLNGVSVVGVLIALGGCLMYAFADELPSKLQADFKPRRTALSPPDRVSPAVQGELLRD